MARFLFVSIAEVVRHSGISSATVFRHFPNRAALVSAAAISDVGAGVDPNLSAWAIADFVGHTRLIWLGMAANLSVAREATVSEAGRELRVARFEGFRPLLVDVSTEYLTRIGLPIKRATMASVNGLPYVSIDAGAEAATLPLRG